MFDASVQKKIGAGLKSIEKRQHNEVFPRVVHETFKACINHLGTINIPCTWLIGIVFFSYVARGLE